MPAESSTWRSPLQLATYRDFQRDVRMQFHYTQGRLPQAVTAQDANGQATYLLGHDQMGSLKAVAAMDGKGDGLRDRFTNLVRFCHRDYDPTVGRFTAPDPLGDTGGDHDLYDSCVDEPVGRGAARSRPRKKAGTLARPGLGKAEDARPSA